MKSSYAKNKPNSGKIIMLYILYSCVLMPGAGRRGLQRDLGGFLPRLEEITVFKPYLSFA
jgi:hypothetical protein